MRRLDGDWRQYPIPRLGLCQARNLAKRAAKHERAGATQCMTVEHLKILTLARSPACSTAVSGAAEAAPIVRFLGQERKGGARAWVCEPVREPNRSGVRSSQTTRSGCS